MTPPTCEELLALLEATETLLLAHHKLFDMAGSSALLNILLERIHDVLERADEPEEDEQAGTA